MFFIYVYYDSNIYKEIKELHAILFIIVCRRHWAKISNFLRRPSRLKLPSGQGMHSPFFWRRNPTKTLGFLLHWISPWFFVGFLLSPPPYAQSFPRKPSVLVLTDFFPWFFKSKQLAGFLRVVYMLKLGPNGILLFIYIFSKLYIAKKIFKHISDSEI